MRIIYCLVSFLLLVYQPTVAQQDWQYLYEEQEGRAEKLFAHYYARQAYQEALPHLEWLLDHRQEAVYHQRAVVVYKHFHEQAKEVADQLRYAKLSLRQFDALMRYQKDSVQLLNQKLHHAYQLFYDCPEQYTFLWQLSREVLTASGSRFAPYNFTPYVRLLLLMIRSENVTEADLEKLVVRLEDIAWAHALEEYTAYQEAIKQVKEIVTNNQ